MYVYVRSLYEANKCMHNYQNPYHSIISIILAILAFYTFSQYGVYSTRIRGNVGSEHCVLRKRGHIIPDIDRVADDVMLLFSPGFQLQPKKK